jgi:hypothetical protein
MIELIRQRATVVRFLPLCSAGSLNGQALLDRRLFLRLFVCVLSHGVARVPVLQPAE